MKEFERILIRNCFIGTLWNKGSCFYKSYKITIEMLILQQFWRNSTKRFKIFCKFLCFLSIHRNQNVYILLLPFSYSYDLKTLCSNFQRGAKMHQFHLMRQNKWHFFFSKTACSLWVRNLIIPEVQYQEPKHLVQN